MVINAIVSLAGIAGLTYLGHSLIEHGIDSTLMMLVVAAISGIAGYNARGILNLLKAKNGGGK